MCRIGLLACVHHKNKQTIYSKLMHILYPDIRHLVAGDEAELFSTDSDELVFGRSLALDAYHLLLSLAADVSIRFFYLVIKH